MSKTGTRKLEDKLEVKDGLLIELMEYVQTKLIEEGKDTERIDDLLDRLKYEFEVQIQNNLEARTARKKYLHEYHKKNKFNKSLKMS